MTGQKHLYFGVPAQQLHNEINRLRRLAGLEEVGGLGFALKIHDHALVRHNPRVAEAIRNLKAEPDRIQAIE